MANARGAGYIPVKGGKISDAPYTPNKAILLKVSPAMLVALNAQAKKMDMRVSKLARVAMLIGLQSLQTGQSPSSDQVSQSELACAPREKVDAQSY